MQKFSSFIFLSLFILFGCKKENPIPQTSIVIPILTGFECKNQVGDRYAIIGEPNIKLNDTEENGSGVINYSLLSFPNPNYRYSSWGPNFYSRIGFFVYSRFPADNVHFWIERGAYNEIPDQTSNELGAVNFIANTHVLDLKFNFVMGENLFEADVSKLDPGYYRAYLRINDVLLWDNLIINKNPF